MKIEKLRVEFKIFKAEKCTNLFKDTSCNDFCIVFYNYFFFSFLERTE